MKMKLPKKRKAGIKYYLLKIFSYTLCVLPYSMLLFLGRVVGKLGFVLLKKQRERAIAQICSIMQLSREQGSDVIRKLFINMGKSFFEVLYIPRMNAKKMSETVEIENEDILREAYMQGKGVIALASHFGNWEWLGAALALRGYEVASLVKEQENGEFMKLLEEYREMTGINALSTGSMEMVVAIKALRSGMVVGFFHDKDAGVYGMAMEFLGKMSSTPSGAGVFARKMGAPIVPLFIKRKDDGGHKIIVQPAFYYTETDADKDVSLYNFTRKLNEVIEEMIYRYPEEWLWTQKRWNTSCENGEIERWRPVGQPKKKRQILGKIIKDSDR